MRNQDIFNKAQLQGLAWGGNPPAPATNPTASRTIEVNEVAGNLAVRVARLADSGAPADLGQRMLHVLALTLRLDDLLRGDGGESA